MNNETTKTDVTIFTNEDFGDLRVIEVNGETWFIVADVCRVLDLSNVTMAVKNLDEDEKAKYYLGLSGGATNCVNESGLYSLVFQSRKPEAKKFRKWVTSEVLPSIRKTGGYSLNGNSNGNVIYSEIPPLTKPIETETWLEIKRAEVLVKAARLVDVGSNRNKMIARATALLTGDDNFFEDNDKRVIEV